MTGRNAPGFLLLVISLNLAFAACARGENSQPSPLPNRVQNHSTGAQQIGMETDDGRLRRDPLNDKRPGPERDDVKWHRL
jgi:hypothetical protein